MKRTPCPISIVSITVLICLVPLATSAERLGPITLAVQDEQGRPVKGAEVSCVNWDNQTLRGALLTDSEKGVSDDDGKVTFKEKTIGQVFVRVRAGECGGWYRVHNQSEHPVVILTVGTGLTVRGTVRDTAGQPLADVVILADSCLPAGKTDESGRFAVPNMELDYSPELVFTKDGYAPEGTHVHFEAAELSMTLRPSADVTGTVVMPDGSPAAGAWIGGPSRQAHDLQTDDEGHFTIPAVPLGENTVISAGTRVEDVVYRAERRLTVTDPLAEPIVLKLEKVVFGSIVGRMLHAGTNEPVQGKVMLDYNKEFYSPSKRSKVDEEGRFTFEQIHEGHYWLLAAPSKLTLYQVGGPKRVCVKGTDGPTEVELVVDDGCAITGRAVTADGAPVAKKYVMWQPMPHYWTVSTERDGSFVIPHLDGAGVTYTVEMQDALGRVARATVGPLEKGQTLNGVELRMPLAKEPATLRGTVRDTAGTPLAGIRLRFQYEEEVEPRSLSTVTDEKGVFGVKVVNSGTVKVRASTGVQIERGERNENLARNCEIVGEDTLSLDATKDQTIELVVKPKPFELLAGKVTDAAGAPLDAQVFLVYGDGKRDHAMCSDGHFTFRKLPDEPYLLEVTAFRYKARVLRPDKDIPAGNAPFSVVLERGPFEYGESVWESVTGTPPTQESVDSYPQAEYVRRMEWQYYEQAKQPVPREGSASAEPRTYRQRMRVVDAAGKPVQRVIIEPQYAMQRSQIALYRAPDTSPQPKSSAMGVYDVDPNNQVVVVTAPGYARVHATRQWGPDPEGTFDVVLRKPASLELRVTDAKGKAMPATPVHLGLAAWESPGNAKIYHIADTDGEGALHLENIAPGFHGFAVGTPESDLQLLLADLKPGEKRVERITLYSGDEASEPQALLRRFRKAGPQRRWNPRNQEKLVAAIAPLTLREERALAEAVRTNLKLLPPDVGWRGWLASELGLLTKLTQLLEDRKALPILKSILKELRPGGQGGTHWGNPWTASSVADAIVALEGNDSVEFFAEVAGDTTLDHASRLAALLALGQIATEDSAAAFRQLRDAAYDAPNAPPRKESYTHAERMAETAHMIFHVLPGQAEGRIPRQFNPDAYSRSVTVSEDYSTGTLNTTALGGWTDLHFRRVGDEWLLERVGSTIVV
jgi:hypothetical protein